MIRKNKYNARKTQMGGITFDSVREAQRYLDLCVLERARDIQDLEIKPVYRISHKGEPICKYIPDFRYKQDGKIIIEDVKGIRTDVYKLKRKMMKVYFGIDILET